MPSSQQINLYVPALRREPPPLHAQMLLELCAIFLVVLVVWGGVNSWRAVAIRNDIEAVNVQVKLASDQLQALQGQRPVSQSERLDRQIQQLETAIEQHRVIGSLIQAQNLGNANGFSAHLTGLARQYEAGVSLQGFELSAGGREVQMQGVTDQAEQVPRYLAKLRAEPALTEARFGVLTIERETPAAPRWLFTLGAGGDKP